MNDCARDVLDPGGQAALSGMPPRRWPAAIVVPVDAAVATGATARMYCRPCRAGPATAGRRRRAREADRAGRQADRRNRVAARRLMPAWPLRSAVAAQLRSGGCGHGRGQVARVEAKPGAGKLALLRAILPAPQPAGTFHVLDADDASGHDCCRRPATCPGRGGPGHPACRTLSALRLPGRAADSA